MLKNAKLTVLVFFIMPLLLTAAYAQSQSADSQQAMAQAEAFQILQGLNEKSELFPESMMGMGGEYLSLAPENCFGLEAVQDWKLAGESAGRNNYGIEFQYAGDPSPTVQVGFLHSNAPFLISDKPMAAGAYAVLANTETFQLTGNSGTSHWERDREVPDTRTEQIVLSSKLDPSLFESDSPEWPRFSFIQESGDVFIVFGENKLPVKKQ